MNVIVTQKRSYANLQMLRADFLRSTDGQCEAYKERQAGWDEDVLHMSELAKCPRMQMLRLTHARKKAWPPQKQANDELMFWQGNNLHALTYAAMDWAGILIAFEKSISHQLPEGWTGRADALFSQPDGPHLWDGKSVRPNAFRYKYDWPKAKDAIQVAGYANYINVVGLHVEYIDRGGTNTPQICDIDGTYQQIAAGKLEALSLHREALPSLPDPLVRELTPHYRKVRSQPFLELIEITEDPPWECGYCDYLHGFQDKRTKLWSVHEDSPCHPDMGAKVSVAKKERGRWTGATERASEFIASLTPTIDIEDEDEPSAEA